MVRRRIAKIGDLMVQLERRGGYSRFLAPLLFIP
jgi:hypothetical protein